MPLIKEQSSDNMYLKSINAWGFKSFADKTEIDLSQGVIGIVGPNGSGKSNIVDAVKWVLGEQSAKSLRATNKMSDVIFSGSKSRDPHTKASVSLTFNNDDHYLNCDFNEIEVKRVLYNNGDNEYYLNNSKVRLKDITELFIDSGASKETFNIISQGEVQDIINANALEKRKVFEEAAGVLKYKKHKEESVRKLEKTTDNLSRINLIINELSLSVEPLKDQSEKATKYLTYTDELKNIEISLIVNDIKKLNTSYEKLAKEKEAIENKVLIIDTTNKKDTSKVEKLKLDNLKLDEKINKYNDKLLNLTNEVSKLESEKQIALERKKYQVEDIKLENNITSLKEEELNLKNNIDIIKKDLEILKKDLEKLNKNKYDTDIELRTLKEKRNSLLTSYTDENKRITDYKNKINVIEASLDQDTNLSYAAKNIINNPHLKGIHNVLIKLINIPLEYSLAIETSLGYNQNVIVVDNENYAKNAINYLKENSLGRATFFPLNVIKPRYVDEEVLDRVKQVKGFIGTGDSLVKNDSIYDNIIKNQLGNVLVVEDIDALNLIGKIINYRYKIVSLDGEILNTGGSITGGKNKNTRGISSLKNELNTLTNELNNKIIKLEQIEHDIKTTNEEIAIIDEQSLTTSKEITMLEEKINAKNNYLTSEEKLYNNKKNELQGIKNIQNKSLDKEIDTILNKYYETIKEKELTEKELLNFKKEKHSLIEDIAKEEDAFKEYNSEYNKYQNNLKELEIDIAKIDVKLNNMLAILNENYQITYEKASLEYLLDLEVDIARDKVNSLKREIKALGDVNLGSISEYERISTRYNFLKTQSADLQTSIANLENIITEMDEIMIDKFKTTFNQVNIEFDKIFKLLFKGGRGYLKLTDENDILNTGVDIIASPPGKKLNSIALLSGGEKALTALCLLFAILNVKPAPFCILDEVEDALDDANVDIFGKYINSIKGKTQFIIITHKKRTMEYADILYGITMQESGVSKLVSVKLDNL
ncbi:MAG TPA: AAA family ATPase [Bacilli bacterium]|nr:AAA family ATPase [Bacilli bacterium]